VKQADDVIEIVVEPMPDELLGEFVAAAKRSGLREVHCPGCGCWMLTRTESDLCPPCRGRAIDGG
jgi:adenine-specific DNA methylase